MSLFSTLLRPDREENPERAEVARAANLLQIGEFQLLQLAWYEWHGDEMPAAVTDRLFADYMLHNQVPHWARHYARRIIGLDAAGLLDDDAPHYHRYDVEQGRPVSPGVRRFAIAATIVVVCVFGGLWTAHLATYDAGRSLSELPPYFNEKQLQRPTPLP